MSAGLTIEQVLARSLRMPRRRLAAQSAIAKTMDRAAEAAASALGGGAHTASNNSTNTQSLPSSSALPSTGFSERAAAIIDGAINTSSTAAQSSDTMATKGSSSSTTSTSSSAEADVSSSSAGLQIPSVVAPPTASVSRQQQRHYIPIPREDPDPYPDRPMLRRLPGLARNCDDLLTHLVACKQLGDWREALTVFAAHPQKHTNALTSSMTVSRAHISMLVDTLVNADKASVVADMAANDQFASDAQADMALRLTASALNRRDKWQEALQVLASMKQSPAPIEAYNEIISACEATASWKEAMKVVFDLKDKHDAYLTELSAYERAKAEEAEAVARGGSSSSTSSADEDGSASDEIDMVNIGGPSSSSALGGASTSLEEDPNAPKQHYPKPDAVTWTTLITILEKSGKDELAQEVLRVVPPAERETILASYAALIYTWSQQKKKRF